VARLVVVPLGCGGWISNPLLGPTALLVRAGGLGILLDAGEGVYRALRACGFDVADVDWVLVTHWHGDHALGLPTLALYAKRAGRLLRVAGPPGVGVERLLEAAGIPHYADAVSFKLVEPGPEPSLVFEEGGVRVYAAAADHGVPALAYRVEAGGLAVAYSGDTRPCESVVRLARGCKLLIHEASISFDGERAHAHGHSTAADAVEAAKAAGVPYLMPVHFYVEPAVIPAGVSIVLPIPCTPVDVGALP
jgi:ribonuclease Z